MAEFCLDCLNRFFIKNQEPITEKDVILDDDFCEACGEYRPCVISITKNYWK